MSGVIEYDTMFVHVLLRREEMYFHLVRRALSGALRGAVAGTALVGSLAIGAAYGGCEEHIALGVPGESGQPLCRIGYALAHDGVRKTPVWVAQRLTRERAMAQATRKDAFAPDPDLPRSQRAELRDYKGSGFDRGHMAPNADFNWSAQAARQSFYLSNMVPQVGRGMNQGIWKELESAVRLWAVRRGEVYVYTGPIYGAKFRVIGKGRVAVPSQLYKIVYDPATFESITFIMPNRPLKVQDIANYVSTVHEVERQTGLKFFTELPTDTRVQVQTTKAAITWR